MLTEQPDILPVAEGLYFLDEEYTYRWESRGIEYRIVVPRGFIHNGASVPRLVWTISGILPDGLIRAAALIHDWIYRCRGRLPWPTYQYKSPNALKTNPFGRIDEETMWCDIHGVWTRKNADRLFARIMREAGMSKRRRRAAYLAVRMFGWVAWRR